MVGWPKNGWKQAGIAFLAASIPAFIAERAVEHSHFLRYAREYPHDGQDGLAAFVDGLQAGALAFVVAWALLFVLQRLIFGSSPPEV